MTPGQRSVAIMHAAINALEACDAFYDSPAAQDALVAIRELQADCPHTHTITHGFQRQTIHAVGVHGLWQTDLTTRPPRAGSTRG